MPEEDNIIFQKKVQNNESEKPEALIV